MDTCEEEERSIDGFEPAREGSNAAFQLENVTGESAQPSGEGNDASDWSEVLEELLRHQCLSSVVNSVVNATTGKTKGPALHADKLREKMNKQMVDMMETKEPVVPSVQLGPIPELADFKPYLQYIAEVWPQFSRVQTRSNARSPQDSEFTIKTSTDTVPQMFFREDFEVGQLDVFSQSGAFTAKSIEDIQELNGELSAHLDTVEVALFEHIQVAQKNRVFESVAGIANPILDHTEQTLKTVRLLRKGLDVKRQKQVRRDAVVSRLACRQERAKEVLQRLEFLGSVQQSHPSIKLLLRAQDYDRALDLIESTSAAVDDKLRGLACVNLQCFDFKDELDRKVEADFIHHSIQTIFPDTQEVGDLSVRPFPQAAEGEVQPEPLGQLCSVFARRGLLASKLGQGFREVFLTHTEKSVGQWMQGLLGQLDASSLRNGHAEETEEGSANPDDDPQDDVTAALETLQSLGLKPAAEAGEDSAKSTSADSKDVPDVSAAVQSLGFETFHGFWQRMLELCLLTARRMSAFAMLVLGSAGVASLVAVELAELLEVVQNQCLQQVGALLATRQSIHARLEVREWVRFLHFTDATLVLIQQVHARCFRELSGGSKDRVVPMLGTSLRTILYDQTKAIIEEFHQARVAEIKIILDQERWERTEVPAQYKIVVAQLMGQELPLEEKSEESADANAPERQIRVEDANFLAVPAVLMLLQDLKDYLQLCKDLPSVAGECAQRMGQLLRQFHIQTSKLVLEGQAVKKKTLAKITASNLALCSQSCGLVATILTALVSQVQVIVRSTAIAGADALAGTSDADAGCVDASANDPSAGAPPPAQTALITGTQSLGELPQTLVEFNELRGALFQKLSDILIKSYESHAKKWLGTAHLELPGEAIQQSAEGTVSVEALHPHEAAKAFVKDVSSMVRVLLKCLTGEHVRKIFAKAFADIAAKFKDQLGTDVPAPCPPYDGKLGRTLGDRIVMDVAFLQEQLGAQPAIATPLQHLITDMLMHLKAADRFRSVHMPERFLNAKLVDALQSSERLPR